MRVLKQKKTVVTVCMSVHASSRADKKLVSTDLN